MLRTMAATTLVLILLGFLVAVLWQARIVKPNQIGDSSYSDIPRIGVQLWHHVCLGCGPWMFWPYWCCQIDCPKLPKNSLCLYHVWRKFIVLPNCDGLGPIACQFQGRYGNHMVWMKKTQIRQGWPWPDRDQTMTGLNFGVTHPPKKTIILWICLAKNMWNINWVQSVQLLVTEMIVIWLRMEDSKRWIHPNSNVHLWLKRKQHSPKVLNHIIVEKYQYEASWLILGAIQPGTTMSIPVAVVT